MAENKEKTSEENRNMERPEEFPGASQKDGIRDDQQAVREPSRPSNEDPENHQSHENRDNPRADHGTGHLGYNRTHLKDNPAPVREGSDKI